MDCSNLCAMKWSGTKSDQTNDRQEQHIPLEDVLHAVLYTGILLAHSISRLALVALNQSPSGYWLSSALMLLIMNDLTPRLVTTTQCRREPSLLRFLPYPLMSKCFLFPVISHTRSESNSLFQVCHDIARNYFCMLS